MLIEYMKKAFAERARKNPSYSLRAFARSLEINSATLSSLLSYKRPLTPKTAKRLIGALRITDPMLSQKLLLQSAGFSETGDDYTELELERLEVISSWHHFAILALLEVDGFKANQRAIASRLNIPLALAIDGLARLERLGLIKNQGGRWTLTGKNLTTPTDVPNAGLRRAHREYLEKAMDSLENEATDRRDITGITMAIDPTKIDEAKVLIKEFRRNLARFLETGKKHDVYRLNIQLFPLTKSEVRK